MFILTEATPNPAAMKFVPHVRLTDGASRDFAREGFDPRWSPLAARLFALAGVRAVYVAADFVTVTRDRDGEAWSTFRLRAIGAIADHLESGDPAIAPALPEAATAPAAIGAEEIEDEIRSVLGLYVRPGVARDGGDVLLERFDAQTGMLWIRMHGACGGCPSSRQTLKLGVERIVRRYVPEVLSVEEAAPQASRQPSLSRLKDWLTSADAHAGPRPRTRFTHGGKEISGGQTARREAS